ncbi:Cornichon [Trypanosoma melophagium]|uniref:Cornichon n=1 Tax=Trypanosoma melophagium TaxID=715481 RepID=UPI00351A7D9E|nr:Cornichon [Trypanosoma melophagium]
MDASHRFREALIMQVDWVQVMLLQRHRPYTKWRRRQALFFAAIHSCFLLVLFGHFTHDVVTWVLSFLLQTGALCVSLFHAAFVNDYGDRMNNAMELEHQVNPLIIAELMIRCFAMLHFFLMGSWLMFLFGVLELIYDYHIFRKGDFLVDATTAWKKLDALKLDSRLRLGYQSIMEVGSILHFIYSLFTS